MTAQFQLLPDPLSLSYNYRFAAGYIKTFAMQRKLNFIFGAGVSIEATGHSWNGLVEACLNEAQSRAGASGTTHPPRTSSDFDSLTEASEWIKNSYSDEYLSIVQSQVYVNETSYDAALSASSISLEFVLRCAMAFNYSPYICCLNFDEFVEDYWKARGILFNSVTEADQASPAGIQIWHPHGKLGRSGVTASDWIVFSSSEYKAREDAEEGLHSFWRNKLSSFMDESRLLVLGAGGDEDVWHENIKFLIDLCKDKPSSSYRGIWALPDINGREPTPSVLDNIAALGFIPLRFDSLDKMKIFLQKKVFELA